MRAIDFYKPRAVTATATDGHATAGRNHRQHKDGLYGTGGLPAIHTPTIA